jgi:RNase P subunit RPR2
MTNRKEQIAEVLFKEIGMYQWDYFKIADKIEALFPPDKMMGEEEVTKVVEETLMPFADAKWRKDKFKFNERVMRQLAKSIAKSLANRIPAKGKANLCDACQRQFPECSKECEFIKDLGAGECENVCKGKFQAKPDVCWCFKPLPEGTIKGDICMICGKPFPAQEPRRNDET